MYENLNIIAMIDLNTFAKKTSNYYHTYEFPTSRSCSNPSQSISQCSPPGVLRHNSVPSSDQCPSVNLFVVCAVGVIGAETLVVPCDVEVVTIDIDFNATLSSSLAYRKHNEDVIYFFL